MFEDVCSIGFDLYSSQHQEGLGHAACALGGGEGGGGGWEGLLSRSAM